MFKKLSLFLLFFALLSSLCFSQQKQIDSLKNRIKENNKQDSTKLNTLNRLAYSYYSINPEEGIKVANKAISLARMLKNMDKLATAYSYKGHNYSANGQDSLALIMYDFAIKIYKENKNAKKVARLIYNKGLIYFNRSNYEKANENNIIAYDVFKKEKDSFLMAKMLNSIGLNYMYQSNYPKALSKYLEGAFIYEKLKLVNDLEYANTLISIGLLYSRLEKFDLSLDYHERAFKIYKKTDYQLGIVNALTNLGNVYDDLGDPKKAINYYEQSLNLAKEQGNKRGIASALTNIGIAKTNLKEYKNALIYLTQAKEAYTKLANTNNLAIVHKNIGLCNLMISDNSSSKSYYLNQASENCQKSLEYAKESGSLNLQAGALELIADINLKKGNYRLAYEVKEESIILKDSFNSIEKKEEIARLESTYTYNQEKAILEVNHAKEKALSNAEIKRQKIIRNSAMAGGGILLLTAILSGVFYKKRRDDAEKIRTTQFEAKVADTELKALRAQMNPHFIFNSLNSINDFIAKNNTKEANEYLIKFSKLTRAILENSDKKWIPIQEEIELTELYMQLESYRLRGKFSYNFSIDNQIDKENTLIPPLILQPFIENSIWHGMAPLKEKGNITISVKQKENMLICIVDDNGVGRKVSNTKDLSKESKGINITKSRLDIIGKLSTTKGSINLTDKPKGLTVELTLPLKHQF